MGLVLLLSFRRRHRIADAGCHLLVDGETPLVGVITQTLLPAVLPLLVEEYNNSMLMRGLYWCSSHYLWRNTITLC